MAPEDEEINVDQLLEDIAKPDEPRAMEGGEIPGEEPSAAAEPVKPTWNGEEWAFETNGKKIIPESRDHVMRWANQGYNYSQKMGDLNKTHAQRMAEIDQRDKAIKEMEAKFSPFAKVDDYAKNNPDWWNHVNQQYELSQQQAQNPGLDPKILEAIKPLSEKLSSLEKAEQARAQEHEQRIVAETETKEDQTLDQEIKSIRDEHANIDFSAKDESGESLERRILLHADSIGSRTFKAAFWDYLGPKLIESAKAEGRGAVAKGKQADVKAGRLGTSQAPVKQLKPANTKAAWNSPEYDSTNILKEYGIGG